MFYFYILWKNFKFPGKCHLNARIMLNAFTPLKCSQNASIMYTEKPTSGWPAILPEKQILLLLWRVANREPHRTIADRFEWNKKIFDNSGNSIKEGALKTYSQIFENFCRNFYRSIQFRTGNLAIGIFGRMESARTVKTD